MNGNHRFEDQFKWQQVTELPLVHQIRRIIGIRHGKEETGQPGRVLAFVGRPRRRHHPENLGKAAET